MNKLYNVVRDNLLVVNETIFELVMSYDEWESNEVINIPPVFASEEIFSSSKISDKNAYIYILH